MPLFLWFDQFYIFGQKFLQFFHCNFEILDIKRTRSSWPQDVTFEKIQNPPKSAKKLPRIVAQMIRSFHSSPCRKKVKNFVKKKKLGIRESWKHVMSLTLFANFSLQSLVSFANPIWVCPDVLLMHSAPSWIPVLVTENH